MSHQGNRCQPFGSGFALRGALALVIGTLALSCASVPTTLRSKVTVAGGVTVADKPLPGTYLSFTPAEPGLRDYAFAVADSSGAYSVRLISGAYDVRVEPVMEPGLLSHTERVTASDAHARVDFSFGGFRVTGRVLTPTGALVDSGRVGAFLIDTGNGTATSPTTQGGYSLLLPAGRYSFRAVEANYWSGFCPEEKESLWITADTTIDFQLGGIPVSGRVQGPDGLPMEGVAVRAEGGRYVIQNGTTADGRYRLYVPAGSYRLSFGPPYPFYIMPRVAGPVSIAVPTTVDEDLSGIEWAGTVRRSGTNEPATEVIVMVSGIEEGEERAAAIAVGSEGDFRFILEPGRRYDLATGDRARRETIVRAHGVIATRDTSFSILISPKTMVYPADSTVRLTIRSLSGSTVHPGKRRWPPDWIEATLLNTGRDTVTLTLPGDGSFAGRRTPLMDWNIHAAAGERLEQVPFISCGNINPLYASQVFTLPPGERKTFTTAVPEYYRYEKSHRYQFQLSYENRPMVNWGGRVIGHHDPGAMRLLRQSTPCRLLSNTLELEVK